MAIVLLNWCRLSIAEMNPVLDQHFDVRNQHLVLFSRT